jgi:hypothetical protein
MTNGDAQVIISAKSSPEVLTIDGFLQYAQTIGLYAASNFISAFDDKFYFSDTECLGLHRGNPQTANLGDGRGDVNETVGDVSC